jgi:uncharacterized membrane protein
MRVAKLAAAARDAGATLPRQARLLMWTWFWLGWPAFGAILATYWLMVAKPG